MFDYHPKCKRIGLTHLCFVNDLMIFTKGNLHSIMGIQNILKLFYSYFGLQLNAAKSELFSSGIKRDLVDEIQRVTGFKHGVLPVRYLGVPLISKRLTIKDCAPLIDKISARINGWSTRFLSYAGRLQLIQTILYSIQNFWSRHFIMPKRVLKRINQLCFGFFMERERTDSKRGKSQLGKYMFP